MFKWANGKVAEIVFYCHSFRVSYPSLGLTTDMIVYLAAIHAYVNKLQFDFGSFLRRLASYFKSIVSMLYDVIENCQVLKSDLPISLANDEKVNGNG